MQPEDDDLPHVEPPAYSRTRDPIDLTARIKAEGMRLDQYLHLNFQDFSRSELQAAIAGGHVTVNGRASKASYKVRNDDQLRGRPAGAGERCHRARRPAH